MNNLFNNKKKYLIISLVLILIAGYFLFFNNKSEYMKYSKFDELVTSGQLSEVTLSNDEVYYRVNGKEYYTVNPGSNYFKENLLLNDVEVKVESNILDIMVKIFDFLFIVIFIVGLYVGYGRISGRAIFKLTKNEKNNFSKVIGMNDLKRDMKEIIAIMKNKEEYAKKGIKQPKGIILEGNPGNGKTFFARALAGEAGMNFIATKATDFESAVMSVGPAKIKSLFRIARKNSPCIVFIDEFDGIGTKRNYSGSAIETENTRIVTALLNELDGFKVNDGVLVLVATNNAKVLDEALIRPGRFDRKYMVGLPSLEDREELINKFFEGKEIDKEVSIKSLAQKLDKMSFAMITTILNEAGIIADRKNLIQINNEVLDEAIKNIKI